MTYNYNYCKYRLPCGRCDKYDKDCDAKNECITNIPEQTFPELNDLVNRQYFYDNIPPACVNCPKHPSNGGDGICNCTAGNHNFSWSLTPGNLVTSTTTTITNGGNTTNETTNG